MKKLSIIFSFIIALFFGAKQLNNSSSEANEPQSETTHADALEDDKENSSEAGRDLKRNANQQNNEEKDYHMPADSKGGILVKHTAYALSFNKKYNTPNWVAWRLPKEHTDGPIERSTKFWADPKLPRANRIDYYEYKESDYNRGHMCPAGDNKWSEKAMYECFYMSNMCPQDPNLNGGQWGNLEVACRRWASTEGEIFIACGPLYEGKKHEIIGINHKIHVPTGFFKVVMSLRKDKEKAIGFTFKNNDKSPSFRKLATSVDKVEQMTGIDFFHKTDDSIEKRIEAQYNINDWK